MPQSLTRPAAQRAGALDPGWFRYMTVTVELRVLHLLCSRICHDLAGPTGAVINGIELIQELGDDPDAEAMTLIASSARTASRRLQYHRVAFGLAQGAASSSDECRSLASELLEGSKIALEWRTGDANVGLSDSASKLLLNMILLAIESLPRGGRIEVALVPQPDGVAATVLARGEGARPSEEVSMVSGDSVTVGDLTARTIFGYLAARLAEDSSTRIDLGTPTPDTVELKSIFPTT